MTPLLVQTPTGTHTHRPIFRLHTVGHDRAFRHSLQALRFFLGLFAAAVLAARCSGMIDDALGGFGEGFEALSVVALLAFSVIAGLTTWAEGLADVARARLMLGRAMCATNALAWFVSWLVLEQLGDFSAPPLFSSSELALWSSVYVTLTALMWHSPLFLRSFHSPPPSTQQPHVSHTRASPHPAHTGMELWDSSSGTATAAQSTALCLSAPTR